MNGTIVYYPNANWASVEGNFTPEELREIAQEIEDRFKSKTKEG